MILAKDPIARERYWHLRRLITDAKFRAAAHIDDYGELERRQVARSLLARGKLTEARRWCP